MIHRIRTPKAQDLDTIVADRLTALVRELEDADWRMEDIVFVIRDRLDDDWMREAEALRKAREATPDTFVSDGNEG